jgi:DNA-binding NarL/FixJ family response regulator
MIWDWLRRRPFWRATPVRRSITITTSHSRILILTTFDLDEYVYEAIPAGASEFLLKDVQPVELVDAIRVVAAGNALLGTTVTKRLLERFTDGAPKTSAPTLDGLTERERQILTLMASGLSNIEIADRPVVGETTVKTHVSSILRKLGVRDRVQAVIVAYDAGLVRAGP